MDKRIKNILRCYASGIEIKETASLFCTSRNTVHCTTIKKNPISGLGKSEKTVPNKSLKYKIALT